MIEMTFGLLRTYMSQILSKSHNKCKHSVAGRYTPKLPVYSAVRKSRKIS